MANHPPSLFGLLRVEPTRKSAERPRQLPVVKNDVSLNALLEMPTAKQPRRSPLEWAGAMGLHIVIVAVLIIVPLYTTGTINLGNHEEVPLVAPAPLPPPAPPARPAVASPHIVHPQTRFTYSEQLTTPHSIQKRAAQENAGAAPPPDLNGVDGGVPGGVVGGEVGGLVGGAFGGTGTAVSAPQPTKRIVRAGSQLKAPRQTYNVNPQYPPLALESHLRGTVVVDALIDEQGNVVQARAVSGHPLLIPAALKAVLQWKYEPTSLNGEPISVRLQVEVHFNLPS